MSLRTRLALLLWFTWRLPGQPNQWHAVTAPARWIGEIGAWGGEPSPTDLAAMRSYEALALLRAGGAATFATRAHAGLPFDLGAARLVDALVVTDAPDALAQWSFLLDHGYAVAPVAGKAGQLFVDCAEPACVAGAIRRGRTMVSTGPRLSATRQGGRIEVQAWGDGPLRVELWAHNRVLATRDTTAGEPVQFDWTPTGAADWVAVRVNAQNGWALSSAFPADAWPVRKPLTTHVKMVFPEVASHQQGMLASVWLAGQRLQSVEMDGNEFEADVPVAARVRVELGDGRRVEVKLPEASGVSALLEDKIDAPLDWSLYEEVLRRCRRVLLESRL